MKRILMLAIMIVRVHAAQADDSHLLHDLGQATSVFWQDNDGMWGTRGSDDYCRQTFDKVAAANVPETATFKLTTDSPDLVAGDYPWPQAKALCDRMRQVARVVDAKRWLELARRDAEKRHGPPDANIFKSCMGAYAEAISVGVPDTQPIAVLDAKTTIGDGMAKWCAAGKQKFDAAAAKRAAPYKKVLKGDKLTMALVDPAFVLPGGAATTDADKLAASSVWFRDTQPSAACPGGGQAHIVHRYEFGASQKLVKSTDQSFCGGVPASAFH